MALCGMVVKSRRPGDYSVLVVGEKGRCCDASRSAASLPYGPRGMSSALKRLKPAKLSAVAARRAEKEMPFEAEIDAEVQAHWKEEGSRKT